MIFRLTRVQTFTAPISLNNPVYGQHSIIEITRCILKTPVVCSLLFKYPWSTFYPRFAVCSPQSVFYTDRFSRVKVQNAKTKTTLHMSPDSLWRITKDFSPPALVYFSSHFSCKCPQWWQLQQKLSLLACA